MYISKLEFGDNFIKRLNDLTRNFYGHTVDLKSKLNILIRLTEKAQTAHTDQPVTNKRLEILIRYCKTYLKVATKTETVKNKKVTTS